MSTLTMRRLPTYCRTQRAGLWVRCLFAIVELRALSSLYVGGRYGGYRSRDTLVPRTVAGASHFPTCIPYAIDSSILPS
jgi:hypothetical protein